MSAKKIMAILVILVIIVISIPLFIYYGRDLPRSDPISKLIFPDDTIYAPRFSESSFLKVQIGMNVIEVINLLGKPLSISEYAGGIFIREMAIRDNESYVLNQSDWFVILPKPEQFVYEYSTFGPKYDNYHIRIIVISAEGIVIAINNSFYSE